MHLNMRAMLVTFALVIILLGNASARSFTNQQSKEHPCLDQTSLPWRINPVAPQDTPDPYKGWKGLWAGHWYGASGKLCHVLVIQKITPGGKVELVYGTGNPYYEHGEFTGTIISTEKGQELQTVLRNGTRVTYTLKNGKLEAVYGGFTGGELKSVTD